MLSNRLTATKVAGIKKPGRYADGNGLWLQVKARQQKGEPTKHISRSWLYRYTVDGKARHMGLGPYPAVSLAEAREKAAAALKQRMAGTDPVSVRQQQKRSARVAAAKAMTFEQCAKAYIASHEKTWRSKKTSGQWAQSLRDYVYPKIGNLPVGDVDTGLVVACLESIWLAKVETANRTRQRIESILDWASALEYREGVNPARLAGHLENILPKRKKKVAHHAAIEYAKLPEFMAELRKREGVAARCLEWTILTGVRTGEAIGARWAEIDLQAKTWTIPEGRMKADRPHVVPLSAAALDALKRTPKVDEERVFPVSNMAMDMLLRRMKRDDITVHGMRSTLRDWISETTAYPHDVAEMVLAHAIKSKTEAAYRRGDLFAKRQRLMEDWGRYCSGPAAGKVLPLRKASSST